MRFLPRILAGLAAGLAIAAVDRWGAGGEVSPIAIVLLLLAVAFTAGYQWSWGGWIAALSAWLPVPGAHVVASAFGWSDTLRPADPGAIIRLAVFTLAIVAVGLAGGAVMRAAASDPPSPR